MPLGKMHIRWWDAADGKPNMTYLTRDEQVYLMTLCCSGRSTLMFAGDLPSNAAIFTIITTCPR